MPSPREPQTVTAANGIAADEAFGAVTPPIYLSSTFAFAGFERGRDYEYTRTANPSRDMLADTLAKLSGPRLYLRAEDLASPNDQSGTLPAEQGLN